MPSITDVTRPRVVVAAIRLIIASLVVGVIHVPIAWNRIFPVNPLGGLPVTSIAILIVFVVILLAVMGLLIRAIYNGRNWARILYSGLIIGLYIRSAGGLWTRLHVSPPEGAIGILQVLLGLSAIALLWGRPSTRWFKRPRTAA